MKPGGFQNAHFVLIFACLAGCASMSEVQRDDVEYKRADFRAKFVEDRARCQFEGGRLFIIGSPGIVDRDGVPRTRVQYVCQ